VLLADWLPSIYHYHYVKANKTHSQSSAPQPTLLFRLLPTAKTLRTYVRLGAAVWSSGLFKNFPRPEGFSFKLKRNCKRPCYSMLTYTVQATSRRIVSFRKVESICTVTQKIRKLANPFSETSQDHMILLKGPFPYESKPPNLQNVMYIF
jgi:hypothetical protein